MSIPTSKWIRQAKVELDVLEQAKQEIIEKLTVLRASLGQLLDAQCVLCKKVILWSGHGKAPRLCLECKKKRKNEYLQTWRDEHPDHIRNYMRSYRRRKRVLIPLDEDLGKSGVFHYRGERTQVKD